VPLAGLELGFGLWLLLVAWGAFVGLDAVSWPQIMVSRPIVAGTVGGLVFGHPESGFLAGAFLEFISFRHPPYGAARYPEVGPAALVAGAAYGSAGGVGVFPLLFVLLAGWVIGWIGEHSIHRLRVFNGWLVGDPAVAAASGRTLLRRHRWAMRLDGLRAAAITAAFLVPVALGARFAAAVEGGAIGARWTVPLAIIGMAGLAGAGARGLGTEARRWPLLAAGVLAGIAVGALRV